ncbi:MAG: DinB family protein, partial [Acidobacteriota bacterium]
MNGSEPIAGPGATQAPAKLRRLHQRILRQFDTYLEISADQQVLSLCREAVSAWNVAQHLEHLVLVDGTILRRLEEPDEAFQPDGKPTFAGRMMMLLGSIPRGRGRAPSITDPTKVAVDQLEARLRETRERFQQLDHALGSLHQGPPLAKHFAFGYLNGAQWLRFVDVHHRHHWKIIRDIR